MENGNPLASAPDLLAIYCPVCNAIIEGKDRAELTARAREHTRDDHDYDVPAEHVDKALDEPSGGRG